ncbi:MAG: hypothetical protein Q9201_000175 [Fulgogasparrea decipioides]
MTCDLDRPCTRCVKRSIGHLCHDEPREPAKTTKPQPESANEGGDAALKQDELAGSSWPSSVDEIRAGEQLLQETEVDLSTPTAPANGHTSSAQLVEPSPASGAPGELSGVKKVNSEYNLFSDFLSTSLLNDGAMFPGNDAQGLYSDSPIINTVAASTNGYGGHHQPNQASRLHNHSQAPAALSGGKAHRTSIMPTDKARETYYMTAADPAGSDTPEERMDKLLEAKYDAGMLRPFNYVNGYARLDRYMDKHMRPENSKEVKRALDGFRPEFRVRMQALTDYELVRVEMWFERSLMEYDRVFASMAIPACCWRRTGEICRGNKEMAELIHVPIEQLRDGKLALHEIIVEDHLVSYWQKFGDIAFNTSQKAMLTSCSLRNPNLKANDPEIRCCFSFTIRRDTYDIPSLIVGNFLPMDPSKE